MGGCVTSYLPNCFQGPLLEDVSCSSANPHSKKQHPENQVVGKKSSLSGAEDHRGAESAAGENECCSMKVNEAMLISPS